MKKVKHIALYTALGAMMAAGSSCKKYLDVNTNPNNPTDVPVATILSNAEVMITYTTGGNVSRMTSSVVQYYSGHRNQPYDYDRYKILPTDNDYTWSNLYAAMKNLRVAQQKGYESQSYGYVGISQVLTAYTFSILTDMMGDIPVKQALRDDSTLTPAYDKQQDIYPYLQTMLDSGIVNLGKTSVGVDPADDDLVYGGEKANWIKLANSLKLRLYNHISKIDATAAQKFLATSPALIEQNSEGAYVYYKAGAGNQNPIYQFDVLSGRTDEAISQTFIDKLNAVNDPRKTLLLAPVQDNSNGFKGQYRGKAPGVNEEDPNLSLYSRVGSAYGDATAPVVIISASEVDFIKAEVALRAGDPATAGVAYNKGISDDFDFLGISSSLSAYVAQPSVAWNGTLQQLINQKYIAMFGTSTEAWVDWRKTGFPALTPAIGNFTGDVIPRKFPVSQTEVDLNGAQLAAGPGIPTPYVELKKRVWWDVE
ncbi:Starch-binding associating with outer membrane [Chitinophaga costaii]|uniref:Starch-binding associating with outer membrane n=1 Tax=Chitinophaga costaii TaxID=1335309 RepID=A0A1C4DXJ3_9BACT|nr:SusD/RagB family nutrient-binding outer membrane lipoprotein [Chitinophaga costaii]PUZ27853.1 SusD/RagB family nutrient-binding outer membrane lipoprotein [Chitinophaga costaii]SCC36087.1 Starch-binding associating with outer membrane [Chitinophaga costaii]